MLAASTPQKNASNLLFYMDFYFLWLLCVICSQQRTAAESSPTQALVVVARAGAYLDWLSALLTKREVMLTIWIMRS